MEPLVRNSIFTTPPPLLVELNPCSLPSCSMYSTQMCYIGAFNFEITPLRYDLQANTPNKNKFPLL